MLKNTHMERGGAYRSVHIFYAHGKCSFIGSIGTYEYWNGDP